MKYLTIIPDYTGSCMQDDSGNRIELQELDLPQDFIEKLDSWHNAYRKIIPLDNAQRLAHFEQIEELDNVGLKLVEELKRLMPGGVKVKYYSEGRLKFL